MHESTAFGIGFIVGIILMAIAWNASATPSRDIPADTDIYPCYHNHC
jgi:hypothetical protein